MNDPLTTERFGKWQDVARELTRVDVTPQQVARAIENDTASAAMFDRLQARYGWAEASRIWQAGCDLYDQLHLAPEGDAI